MTWAVWGYPSMGGVISLIQRKIPAVYMRGGTSKGLFFRAEDLPQDPETRDRVLLRAMGSPDPYQRQIDGLGGATSSTSKAVIISRSSRPDCDVDYLFAQVSVDQPVVDYSGSCGNLASAVGPFAIEEGFVPAVEGSTLVRIWQVNTGVRILAHVPVRNGVPDVEGDLYLDGVPTPGAPIRLEFVDPSGGKPVLPTGNVVDHLSVPGCGSIPVTVVNAGNLAVFVDASTLGLTGTELRDRIDSDRDLLSRLEDIRTRAAVLAGLGASPDEISRHRPATPKVAIVGPPQPYITHRGSHVTAEECDLTARMLSMGRLHHAFPVTGAIALAVAAKIPGSVVERVTRPLPPGTTALRIGHPSGILLVGAEVTNENGIWRAKTAVLFRTARRLMEGYVLVPMSVWPEGGGSDASVGDSPTREGASGSRAV